MGNFFGGLHEITVLIPRSRSAFFRLTDDNMYRCLRRLYRYSLLDARGFVVSSMRKFNRGYEYEMINLNGEKGMIYVTDVDKELENLMIQYKPDSQGIIEINELAIIRATNLCYNYRHLLTKDKDLKLLDFLVLDDDMLLGGDFSSSRQKQLLEFFNRIDVLAYGYVDEVNMEVWTEEFSSSVRESVFLKYFLSILPDLKDKTRLNATEFCYALDRFLIKSKSELAADVFVYLAKLSGARNVSSVDKILNTNELKNEKYLQAMLGGIEIDTEKLKESILIRSVNKTQKEDGSHPNFMLLKLLKTNSRKIVGDSKKTFTFINFNEFQEVTKRSNGLLYPVILLQEQMRKQTCGIKYWGRRREQAVKLAAEPSRKPYQASLRNMLRGVSIKITKSFRNATTSNKKRNWWFSPKLPAKDTVDRSDIVKSKSTNKNNTNNSNNKKKSKKKEKQERMRKKQSFKAIKKMIREDEQLVLAGGGLDEYGIPLVEEIDIPTPRERKEKSTKKESKMKSNNKKRKKVKPLKHILTSDEEGMLTPLSPTTFSHLSV